ncbi:MAG: glutamate ABC transporter substrate-binding protein [Pseudonocardiaceae bacterium]
MIRRLALAACLAAAAVSPAAACQQSDDAERVPSAAGSAVVPPPARQETSQQCDRRASLRPQGPLPAPGLMPAGSTMARIVERGRLIAGVDQNTYLFGFRNPFRGGLEGFDIDIVRDVAEAMLGDRNRVEFRVVDIVDRVRVVADGQVDLVVATTTITCDRRDQVEFSIVYFEAGQRVLVNERSAVTGIDDLGKTRVCAPRGSTSLQNLVRAPSRPIPVGVANISDCLVLLQLGEVDAVSAHDSLLGGLAAQDPRTTIVGERFVEEPYGVAINRGDPDLVRFVNAVLERRMADGKWRASYERWLGPLGRSPQPPQPRYRD